MVSLFGTINEPHASHVTFGLPHYHIDPDHDIHFWFLSEWEEKIIMFVDRKQFMFALHSNGGWIDPNGHVIHKVDFGDGNVTCFYVNRDYTIHEIDLAEIIGKGYPAIPRLFTGYKELAFLKKWYCKLSNEIERYDLTDFLKDTYPPFYDQETSEEIQKRGGQVFSRVLRMVEENDFIADMYNQFSIEEPLLEQWYIDNNITLIVSENS